MILLLLISSIIGIPIILIVMALIANKMAKTEEAEYGKTQSKSKASKVKQ